MNDSKIPFLDMVTPHLEHEEKFVSLFREALKTGRFIGGPMVEGFENDFARFCNAEYCIGVGSGTDALLFALVAAGVRPGEIVITVPNTFIATTEAITRAGAEIRFVDIDEKSYNIDVKKLKEYLESCDVDDATGRPIDRNITKTISAIIPVHLYGQMAEMDSLMELAEKHKLLLIEDACQAHGAEYYSKKCGTYLKAGSLGDAAAFSFYPGKNLGAFGEAGAVTTKNGEIARKIKMLRDHGQSEKYYHDMEGYNGRLDAIQAGVLALKLRGLREGNERRRENAHRYNHLFKNCREIITPYEPEGSKSVYHLYVIRTKDRMTLQKYLNNNGISTGLHYPVPLHQQKAYSFANHHGSLEVAERVSREVLSLPMFPDLTPVQQKQIAEKTMECFTLLYK